MFPENPPRDAPKSADARPPVPLIVRTIGILWMIAAVVLLFGFVVVGWKENRVVEYLAENKGLLFFLSCVFFGGWGLLRGKWYGILCLGGSVIGGLIPIVTCLQEQGFTWWALGMLLPVILFGVIPLFVALRSWRSFMW